MNLLPTTAARMSISGPRAAAALAALAALSLSLACSSQEEQIRRARAEVSRAMAAGDLDAARDALERLRKSEPDTPEAVQQIANLMVRAGEAPQALWLLQDGLQRFPERHDLRLLFAQVALMLGEASRAAAQLEPIQAESLFHADALVLRARAMLELGDLEEALAILEEADALYPELPAARRVRIQVLFQEQRFEEVLALLEEAKTEATSEAERNELRVLEARARGAQGEHEEAVGILLDIAEENPDGFAAWDLLVRGLTGLDRGDEALALMEAALEEDPERRSLYPLLADIHTRAGRRDEAEAVLRRFIEVSQSPSAYLSLIRFHRVAGDTERALAVLEEGLEEFPSQPMLQSARVQALLDLDRADEVHAILAEMESEAQIGERLDLEYLRARLALAKGDAEAAAERLRELTPKLGRPEAYFYLGRALEELNDLEGAQRAYTGAQQASAAPEPALALLRVARKRADPVGQRDAGRRLLGFPQHRVLGFRVLIESLLELGKLGPAEQTARRFVAQEPETLEAHLLLARTLWQQERLEEAEAVLDDGEARLGPSPELMAERAAVLAFADRTDDGIAALKQALAQKPEDTALMQKLAGLYFEKNDFEAGSALVDRTLELEPDNLDPLRLRILYTAVNGPLDIALRDAQQYLDARPRDHEIHFYRGAALVKLGRTDAAIASYRRAAELSEGAFAPRNNLAVLFQESGDLETALEFAHEAYERAEDDPDVLDTLGWIYFEQGLLDRAISVLQEAHTEAPGSLGSLHLALAYREAGRTDDAEELLSELVARADVPTDLRSQAEDALRTLAP